MVIDVPPGAGLLLLSIVDAADASVAAVDRVLRSPGEG
jgi:hypothetical protein